MHACRRAGLASPPGPQTFLEEEQLDADESWYCSKCTDHVQADKKLDLWSLPDVLVILLQRFSHSRWVGWVG